MHTFSKSLRLMGNNFTITVVCENEMIAQKNTEVAIAEIQRIEK